MKNQTASIDKLSLNDLLLNGLRTLLKRLNIQIKISILRQFFHFGPWRHLFQRVIRNAHPPKFEKPENGGILSSHLQPENLAEAIRYNSYAIAGTLSDSLLEKLTKITDQLEPNEYKNMYDIFMPVRTIADSWEVRNVVRQYLKCEPVLLESNIMVTKPETNLKPSSQNMFHIDYAGWESLNVFVYLTDVSEKSSYHEVLCGSHRKMGWRDILKTPMTPEELHSNYSGKVAKIRGNRGTLFFENTEAFHRRFPGMERRVMLNLLFATHKSWASNGRASKKDLERRANILKDLEHKG